MYANRDWARVLVAAAVSVAVLTACSSNSLGIAHEYSCTDDGTAQTLDLAREIGKTVQPGYVASLEEHAHGCDSTTREVYEFDLEMQPAIVDQFNCQDDADLTVYEDGMRCSARSGEFALYPIPEDGVVFVEALP